MKRILRKTLFGLLGGSLILGSLGACAARNHGWGPGAADAAAFRSRIVDKAAGKLDLDAAQKARLVVLADRLQAQRQALRGGPSEPGAALRALVAGNTLDRSAAEQLVDERVAVLRAGSPEVIAAAADFFDNLRPDQQQKVREFMARSPRWGHRG